MPTRASNLSFDSGPPLDNVGNKILPTHLQRNLKERSRLQGLMHAVASIKSGDPAARKKNLSLMDRRSKPISHLLDLLARPRIRPGAGSQCAQGQSRECSQHLRMDFHDGQRLSASSPQSVLACVLHSAQQTVDVIFILFPVCRNFISLLPRTPLNDVIPFDKNITFYKQIAWSIVFFTVIHIISHINTTRLLAIAQGTGFVGFLAYNFTTGPGTTGWIMTLALGIMVWFAMEKKRRANFERFWYSHDLFIVFFIAWQFHGMFCMIRPDRPPFYSAGQIGVFWKYWLPGGALWFTERILREIRARHVTYISKVIQHPCKVVEVQIKKERTTRRAGQYIFINLPTLHLDLDSAPEEDYLSVHIRVAGDWTTAFAKALGCDYSEHVGDKENGGFDSAQILQAPLHRTLPQLMLDGPFGSASEDFTKFETVMLVGVGIGVTPFASILKSIWYRLNGFGMEKKTRLSKVYLVWVIRDFGAAEWFHSLLQAVEAEDTDHRIEIHIYLTAKIKDDDVNNILVQDVGAEKDSITSLRSPIHFGRPNWDKVFEGIASRHSDTDCGVFFCGPPVLSKTLHTMSNKYTTPEGCRVFFRKENF